MHHILFVNAPYNFVRVCLAITFCYNVIIWCNNFPMCEYFLKNRNKIQYKLRQLTKFSWNHAGTWLQFINIIII